MKKLGVECGKNKKGITLVALIVTIVVLLILAGVSLNLLVGNNGIITRAKQAQISNDLSSYKEQLAMFIAEKKVENPEFYESSLTAGKNSLYYNTKISEDEKTIKDIISDVKDEYLDSLEVVKGKLMINTQDKNMIKVAQAVGIEPNPYDIRDGVLQSSDGNLLLMDENGTLRIPDSVVEIGSGAFSGVTGLKTIIIPGTVKTIADSAFAYNTTLETVILEEGVQVIGNNAFESCNNIKNVNLPQSLNKIGELAFYYCTKLETIKIPGNVENIQSYAFCGCKELTSVTIEEGATRIEYAGFADCTKLTTIEIPSSIKSIGAAVFNNDTALSNIKLNNNTNYTFADGFFKTKDGSKIIFITDEMLKSTETLEIPEKVTNFEISIVKYTNLKQIKIPSTLTTIISAGNFPKSISNVVVDINNTKYISENGILYTKDTKELIMCYSKDVEIRLKEGIINLREHCFKQAENANSIVLPESLEQIGAFAFSDDTKYEKIKVGKKVSLISPTFKYGNYFGTVEISEENPYYTIDSNMLYKKDKKKLICALYKINGELLIPGTVEEIENAAFNAQGLITKVVISEGTKIIGDTAFSQCSGLQTVEIPSTVTSIGSLTFERCSNLSSIIINNKEGSIDGAPWGTPKGMRAITWKK